MEDYEKDEEHYRQCKNSFTDWIRLLSIESSYIDISLVHYSN